MLGHTPPTDKQQDDLDDGLDHSESVKISVQPSNPSFESAAGIVLKTKANTGEGIGTEADINLILAAGDTDDDTSGTAASDGNIASGGDDLALGIGTGTDIDLAAADEHSIELALATAGISIPSGTAPLVTHLSH